MAGYLVYVPGARGADPAQLERVGLADLFDGSVEFAECFQGPDGKAGAFAFASSVKGSPVLDVAAYQWTPAVPAESLAAGRFWLGLPKEPLTPEDVARKELHEGYWITLGDGNKWCIPAAAMLPHKHGLNGSGEHVRSISPRFADYWERSQQYAAQFFAAFDELQAMQAVSQHLPKETSCTFTLADTWTFCVRALSINYRLNADLVSLLGLLDDDGMANICKAACDLPVLIKVADQKKTDVVTIPVGLSI